MRRAHLVGIGAMVVVAILLVVRALFFLHPQPGDGGTSIRVRFQNIDKIMKGSKVTFAGKPVGEVKQVHIIQEALGFRPRDNEIIYPYELLLSLDSSIKVYPTDTITAKTSGLMGERFIAIIPRSIQENGILKPLGQNDIMFAYEPSGVEDALQDISSVTKKADSAFSEVVTLIQKNQETISQTIHSLQKASEGLFIFLANVNNTNIVADIKAVTQETKDIVTSIKEAEGTLGMLIQNRQLHTQSVACLQKMNFLFDSLSSYGLFFHTNREWQREKYLLEKQKPIHCTPPSCRDSSYKNPKNRIEIIQQLQDLIRQISQQKLLYSKNEATATTNGSLHKTAQPVLQETVFQEPVLQEVETKLQLLYDLEQKEAKSE